MDFAEGSGVSMIGKFGKREALVDGRSLRMENYLAAGQLPKVPAALDWQQGLPWDADPLGNDEFGCCVYAAIGHAITLACKLAGVPSPVTREGVLAAYAAGTGFDPARPETDRGAYILEALKQWRNDGICGTKLEAFVSVAPWHVAEAIALFGGVIGGLALPDDLTADIWSDTSQPGKNGHAEFFFAPSPALLVADTWGIRKPHTVQFVNRYSDEWYAFIIEGLSTPSGLDLAKLRSDLALIS